MRTRINLSHSIWAELDDVFVRGHAFHDGDYVDSTAIGELVQETDGIEELITLLEEFNGFYSIVTDRGGKAIIAADRMRTGPVFYSSSEEEFLISDNCGWIVDQTAETHRSETSEIEYKRSRIVTGSNTLYEEISQLQSGKVVVLDKSNGDMRNHHHHVHTTSSEEYGEEEIKLEFEEALENAFDRLVRAAQGRQIVVPLSGGYDSRLIALMLKQTDYENILAYSDQSTGSENAEIAKKVADNLDLPWITVNLTHSDWHSFYNSDKWGEYFDRASYIGSLPIPAHVLTLEALRNRKEISQDAIFVPGHSALDTMKATPPKLEGQSNLDVEELTNYIIDQHFKYNAHIEVPEKELSDRITKSIRYETPDSPQSLVEAFERWRLKERRAKLIMNANRSFDFMGFDWWMPLEDKELYEFWRMVPLEQKRHRSFYEGFIEDLYADIADLGDEKASEVAETNIKKSVSRRIQNYPLSSLFRSLYQVWEESRFNYIYMMNWGLEKAYQSDPRFGIMTEEQLKQMYHGQDYLFYSLLAQLMIENTKSKT